MNSNQTQQTETRRTFVNYEDEDEDSRGVAEVRTPSHEDGDVTFRRMMEEPSPLHEEILAKAEEMGVPTHIIDLPAMMTPQYDEQGRMYVSDLNNVIRYYVGMEGQVVPTDEFIENAQMCQSNERTNTLEQVYNLA
jgi:hypothetical protein